MNKKEIVKLKLEQKCVDVGCLCKHHAYNKKYSKEDFLIDSCRSCQREEIKREARNKLITETMDKFSHSSGSEFYAWLLSELDLPE